jgi:hypothetical protein
MSTTGMRIDSAPASAGTISAGELFGQQHERLQLLSELAERFADAGWRDALRAAPDAAALRALLLEGAR